MENEKIFLITEYGAVADGDCVQTEAIQKAIDACFLSGGGRIVVPQGTYLTGGIRLRSNCTLYLQSGAVLKGTRNPEDYFGYLNDTVEPLQEQEVTDMLWRRTELDEVKDYRFMRVPGSRWNNGLVRAVNANNIAIIGEKDSFFDGSDCFDALGEEGYRGPHAIHLFRCRNVHLEGYSVRDSANWAHAVFFTENLSVNRVSAYAGHDGIHITRCKNVEIRDCSFYTGDDCVAGFGNLNVHVTGCTLNSACSAFRFGGTNAVFERCHMYGPCKYLFRGSLTMEEKKNGIKPKLAGHRNNMLSAFTYYGDESFDIPYTPGNIVVADCTVEGADKLIHYNYSGNEIWQLNRPLDSITFERVTVKDVLMPSVLYGDASEKVTLSMKHCKIAVREGYEQIEFMDMANFKCATFENVELCNFRSPVLFKLWSDGEIVFRNFQCDADTEHCTQMADSAFECACI